MNYKIFTILFIVLTIQWVSAIQGASESYAPSANLNIDYNQQLQKVKPSPKPSPKPKPSPRPSNGSSSNSGFSSLLGFIVGPILFISAFPCIWYNERRAAIEMRRINFGKTICEDVDVYNQSSAQGKDGKLVYATGQTTTNVAISDPICGVGGTNLLKIERAVQVLQWRQKTKKEGDREQVYYEMQWVTENSSTEGERYNNPGNWFIQNETIYNKSVFLGGYNINQQVIDLCQKKAPFSPSRDIIDQITANSGRNDRVGSIAGQYVYFTPTLGNNYTPPSFDNYQNVQNKNNSCGQTVGTLRVHFLLCPIGPMSLIGKSTVGPFEGVLSSFNIAEAQGTHQQVSQLPSGFCCFVCGLYKHFLIPFQEILVVQEKSCSKQDLFAELSDRSKNFTTIFRILAYISMVFGICLFFSPITTILGYIPLVGGFVSGVVGFAIFIGAVLFCIPMFVIALSLAWLRFHPKIGLVILSVGLIILAYFWINGKPQQIDQIPST